MTDLKITQLCAEAMGYDFKGKAPDPRCYSPLNDDAQCMALIKRFHLNIGQLSQGVKVFTAFIPGREIYEADDYDLNRAVCKCIAKKQMSE
jgi:hypothetical protein